eukprot:COSAG02_NODE_9781_length_2111_cov_274.793213_2_plen_274_part_00
MGLFSQVSALLIIAGAAVAYLHATQPETVAPLLQQIRVWLLERLGWDIATLLPELAPQPEPEPYAAPAFVSTRKVGKKATKKPKAKTQPSPKKQQGEEARDRDGSDTPGVELRLDPSDGNYYQKESFVEVYGGTREWNLQEATGRFGTTTEVAGDDTTEGWTVVPSPSDGASTGEADLDVGESWWSDGDDESDQWETVDEASKKHAQRERRRQRAAAAEATPWAAGRELMASGGGTRQGSNDGLTKKQRENKRKAAKKKAMKEAVDAARKAGR